MEQIAIFCKSFSPDFDRLARLIGTLRKHNRDNIPFILSLPPADIATFRNSLDADGIAVVADPDLTGFAQGEQYSWTYQQVVKLCIDRLRMADAYLVVDSDFYFHRDFGRADLLSPSGHAYTLLSPISHNFAPDNYFVDELLTYVRHRRGRPFTEAELGQLRSGRVPEITQPAEELSAFVRTRGMHELFGHPHVTYATMPGPILRADVLAEMRERLTPRRNRAIPGDGPALLIAVSPWEYVWYSEYLLASGRPIELRQLQFIHFPTGDSVDVAKWMGVRQEHLVQQYLGVAMAARHHDRTSFD